MKEFGPTRFERLAQGNQDRSEMIQENLEAWLPKNNQVEITTPRKDKIQEEITPLPFVKKVPRPLRKVAYASLTFTGLSAACTGIGGNGKEAGQPEVESPASTERFLDLPFPQDPNMKIQQGWLEEDGDEHNGIDYIKGTLDRSATWEPFPVLTATAGRACANPPRREGNAVLIEHRINNQNYETYYGHLAQIETQIPECDGDRKIDVLQGQQIGIAGSTGTENPRWVHLHFQLKRVENNQRIVIDPYDLRAKRAEYPDPNFTNGKVCGQNHLWISCPTTLVQEQSPTPAQGEPRVLSTQDIKIIKENLRPCRTAVDSQDLSQDYWGGWIVENERQDFWIKNFNALIELKSPEGFAINTVQVEGGRVVAPAGEQTWIIGTGRGGIGSRDIFPAFAYSGEGSQVADINLILTGPFNWEPVLDNKTDYYLTSEVTEHRLNNPYNLAPGYGRHELSFEITNTGNLALANPSVFGFIYNLQGELVDMVWGWLRKPAEQNFISMGETVEIKAPSVSRTGRCVGKIDPVGYTLEYFVDFQGVFENSLTVHDIVGVR